VRNHVLDHGGDGYGDSHPNEDRDAWSKASSVIGFGVAPAAVECSVPWSVPGPGDVFRFGRSQVDVSGRVRSPQESYWHDFRILRSGFWILGPAFCIARCNAASPCLTQF